MDADRALARAGARDHPEFIATPPIDRRVLSVDERERAAGDRPKEWVGIDDVPDLARDPLEAARQTQRARAPLLLGAIVADSRAQDDEHESDDHRFGDELRDWGRDPERDADRFLDDPADQIDRPGERDARGAEPEHREGADPKHDDESDASLVRRARGHPHPGGGKIADDDEDGDVR